MAELEILTNPNPILRAKAQVVTRFSLRIQRLAHNMLETMYAVYGIGLATPQPSVQKRVIVVGVGDDPLLLRLRALAECAQSRELGMGRGG